MSSTGSVLVVLTGRGRDWDALEWASAEAAARGSALRIVHLLRWPVVADPTGFLSIDRDNTALPAEANRALAEATRRARAIAPSLDIEGRIEARHTTSYRTGQSVVMVVVGAAASTSPSRRLVSGLLGLTDPSRSDAESILDAVDAPVVQVSLRPESRRPHPATGQVVVGVEPTVDPGPALLFAFDAAWRRSAGLLLLRPFGSDENEAPRRRRSIQRLDGALDGCRSDFPSVQVTEQHVGTRLARTLLQDSTAAALVVLGTRRTTRLRRALAGSVEPCLHRAVGTVAIVGT